MWRSIRTKISNDSDVFIFNSTAASHHRIASARGSPETATPLFCLRTIHLAEAAMAPPPVADSIRAVDDETGQSERRRLLQVEIRSVTKDSLGVAWYSDVTGSTDDTRRLQSALTSSLTEDGGTDPVVTGYKVRYQAVGSTFVQYSHLLKVSYHGDVMTTDFTRIA